MDGKDSSSGTVFIHHRCLVIGGNGALGREILKKYKAIGWETISVDFSETEGVDLSFYIQSFEKYEVDQIISQLTQQNLSIFILIYFRFVFGLFLVSIFSSFIASLNFICSILYLMEFFNLLLAAT